MTKKKAAELAESILGKDRWDAEKILVGAGLSPAGAAAVVARHLGVVKGKVVGLRKELANCIWEEIEGGT